MDRPRAALGGAPIPDPSASRVLLAGDVHGDIGWWRSLCRTAVRHGCDTILQLGDFGLWPSDMERWVGAVTWCLEHHGLAARFIDGNHDWHPGGRAAFPADDAGIRPVHDGRLDWGDRGSRWTWQGRTFVALGGAASVDQEHRTRPGSGVPVEAEEWWPTEAITHAEVDAVVAGGPADVLVTHDAPVGMGPDFPVLPEPLQTQVDTNRCHVTDAACAVAPQLLVHGHLHVRYSDQISTPAGSVQVEGIASNVEGDTRAWAILDLDSLEVISGHTTRRKKPM